MQDDLKGELADYRAQLQWIVDAGYLLPAEAEEAADSIACAVRLCRRGHITSEFAGMLIDRMGRCCAQKFVRRNSAH